MSNAFLRQSACTSGSKETLFKLDNLIVNTVGYTRVASTTSPWPAAAASLDDAESVVWRNPTSGLVRFEVRAAIDVTASDDTFDLYLSPYISSSGGWAAASGSPVSNPVTTAAQFIVNDTDHRLTVVADDNRVIVLVEWAANNTGAYFGRMAGPLETSTYDEFPVALWAGVWTRAAFLTGWKKIYAEDETTALGSGFLLTLAHPSDTAKNPTATGKGQTTLSSANWHWETPILAFDETSGIARRERVGRPDGVFVRENASEKILYGVEGQYASVLGVVLPWPEGEPIQSAYP